MSSRRTSLCSHYLLKTFRLATPNGPLSSLCGKYSSPAISVDRGASRQQVDISNICSQGRAYHSIRKDLNAARNLPSGPSIPSGGSPFSGWSSWMLLAMASIVLPFFTGKWEKLFLFEKKVDSILECATTVVETIEVVAEGVDKIADGVSENLPEDSMLRKSIEKIDHVAEQTIKGAEVAEKFLQEVESLEDKMENILKDFRKKPVVVHSKATGK